jgi:hypothetical protein
MGNTTPALNFIRESFDLREVEYYQQYALIGAALPVAAPISINV